MKISTLLLAALLPVLAHAESGTLSFSDFVHDPDLNKASIYSGFSFGAAWFPNPTTELRDPYLALSTNGGARTTLVKRVDGMSFTLDSFNYSGRSAGGKAYLVLYDGATTVFSGTTNNAGRLQFRSPIDTPGGQTFNVAARSGYTGKITAFAFAFDAVGGGFGDGSDSNQFAFDTMVYSNATPIQAVNPPPLPAIPEPSSLAMFLAGFIALLFRAKRIKQRQ